MTYQEILECLFRFFKGVNAVSSLLSRDEIGLIKLLDLAWFDMQADPDGQTAGEFPRVVRKRLLSAR
jgi:hypothetical protein